MIQKSFKNFSFQKKIFIACLLCSLFPTIVFSISCYYREKALLIIREENALSDSLALEKELLNSQFSSYQRTMNYLTWNQNLNLALYRDYQKISDMFTAYRDTIDPLLNTMRTINSKISNITLYTNILISPHGNFVRPLSDIENIEWYSEVYDNYKTYWLYSADDQTLALICRLVKSKGSNISIAKISLDYALVFQELESIYDKSFGILMTDSSGEPIFRFHTSDIEGSELTAEQLLDETSWEELQKEYVIQTTDTFNHWRLFLYRPIHTFQAPVRDLRMIIFIILLVSLSGVLGVSFLLSRYISKPLNGLLENIQQIENGNFISTVTWNSTDEFGQLITSFHNMVQKLHHLVNEVLEGELLQKKYEMAALQAQINPHFLYNSLSLINSKAILSDQEDIQQMVQYLTTFYRTVLNKGLSTITVREELENVRSYIGIQLFMHSNSFDVSYEIEEEIFSLYMINFCLQPLVENAILHGIDHRENTSPRGELCIRGYRTNETLTFEITDNGPGIPSPILENILNLDCKGYGVQNVHRRIQLACGSQYGLRYENCPNAGTKVTITLPAETS